MSGDITVGDILRGYYVGTPFITGWQNNFSNYDQSGTAIKMLFFNVRAVFLLALNMSVFNSTTCTFSFI